MNFQQEIDVKMVASNSFSLNEVCMFFDTATSGFLTGDDNYCERIGRPDTHETGFGQANSQIHGMESEIRICVN